MENTVDQHEELADFVSQHQPLLVITGAGCSTAAGIPDYRDENGQWKQKQPMDIRDFTASESNRKRYWARSMHGFPIVAAAKPAGVHHALRNIETAGLLQHVITQNVDGLHQQAGSEKVLELHGNLHWVICLDCGHRIPRREIQNSLLELNQGFESQAGELAPDGDVHLQHVDYDKFKLLPCPVCSGILKPDVVFYGESVPKDLVRTAYSLTENCAAILVLGSSVMVYSAYRFCKRATALSKPLATVNIGVTRADAELALKLEVDCGEALMELCTLLELGA